MIDDRTLVEAYVKRCDELEKILPKHAAAKRKYEELDNARLDIEADIKRMRELLEDMDRDRGTFHDQLSHDFSIEKYGRNRRFDEPRHGDMIVVCHCEVQCPLCKQYAATVRYVRRRYGDREIIKEEIEKGVRENGFYYCEDCGGRLR